MFCKSNFKLCLLVVLITNIYSSNLNTTNLNTTDKKTVESKEPNFTINVKQEDKSINRFHNEKIKDENTKHEKIKHEVKKFKLKPESKFPTKFFKATRSSKPKKEESRREEFRKEELYKINTLAEQIKCRLNKGSIIHKPEVNSAHKPEEKTAHKFHKDFGFCTKQVDIPLAELKKKVVLKKIS